MRSHNKGTGANRPFRCDLCPKDFICEGNLVTHRRSHSGEKPFSCPQCNKSFVEKGNLMRHLRKNHGNSVIIEPHLEPQIISECGNEVALR